MLKTTTILLLFFVLAVPSLAQSHKNTWLRLQGGSGLSGAGDRNGFVGNLSGGRYFSPRFKAGLGLGYASFDNGAFSPAEGNKASALMLDLSAYFHVVHTNWFKVEVGAGPSLQFWQWDYEADASTTIFISRSRSNIRILPGQSVSIDDTLLGYGLSVGLIGTPNPNLEFGVWGVYQRNREGENIASARAGVGLRF